VNNAPTRQMVRKVAARRLAPREALHLDAGRFGLGLILARSRGKLLELQFQLVEKSLTALGARPEHLALHFGDHQLQMHDHCLCTGELGARLDQRSLERIYVVWEPIRCRRHATSES